jgi:hypothetical protein
VTLLSPGQRRDVLRRCGAGEASIAPLLDYGASPYGPAAEAAPEAIDDEPHVAAWEGYVARAGEVGAVAALRERFAQLRFPIAEGMSREPAYRAATLRGEFAEAEAFAPGLVLRRPEAVTLAIAPSAAGRVPVIVAGDRADFEALVRAFTERNEPAEVPASMGACLVGGLINWHRIAIHREQWAREAADGSDAAWAAEFKALVPQKARYQDRLVLLSAGPYSAVPAEECGGPADGWPARSVAIRREHELFHYFTYRRFGRIRTHVFDELLADFAGLVRADGEYRAGLALRFLGLDRLPAIRPDGRILNYVRERLPGEAWPIVAALAARAAANLEAIGARHRDLLATPGGAERVFAALCPLALDELASDAAPGHVEARLGA